jgi:hypothetical protein
VTSWASPALGRRLGFQPIKSMVKVVNIAFLANYTAERLSSVGPLADAGGDRPLYATALALAVDLLPSG